MIRQIGRFRAYFPDHNPYEVVKKCLLASSLNNQEVEFDSSLHELHLFFYRMKIKYPEPFVDVFFSQDTDFPYSEQIEDAFLKLQEVGYLTRPNPSMYRYKINCHGGTEIEAAPEFNEEDLKDIAAEFNVIFHHKSLNNH
jgi:hypothetical protein